MRLSKNSGSIEIFFAINNGSFSPLKGKHGRKINSSRATVKSVDPVWLPVSRVIKVLLVFFILLFALKIFSFLSVSCTYAVRPYSY